MKIKCNVCKKEVEVPCGESIELCMVKEHITTKQVKDFNNKKSCLDNSKKEEGIVKGAKRCYELTHWDGQNKHPDSVVTGNIY
jgi:hypothetical protein